MQFDFAMAQRRERPILSFVLTINVSISCSDTTEYVAHVFFVFGLGKHFCGKLLVQFLQFRVHNGCCRLLNYVELILRNEQTTSAKAFALCAGFGIVKYIFKSIGAWSAATKGKGRVSSAPLGLIHASVRL